MKNSNEHLGYLDGWRGLAILALLVGHMIPMEGINVGRFGVFLFFVLSGYLMTGLLFQKQTRIGLFYKRRIARIFPAMIVYLACIVAYCRVADVDIAWDDVLGALFLVNYPQLKAGYDGQSVGHFWSLAVEEHAYILLSGVALLVRFLKVRATAILALLAAGCAVVMFAVWSGVSSPAVGLPKWSQSEAAAYGIFASGALLLALHGRVPRLPALAFPVLMLLALALQWWRAPPAVQLIGGVGVLAVTINLLERAPLMVRNAMSWRPLRAMGTWSYSIYLWQQPFYVALSLGLLEWYAAMAGSVAAGLVSYYLVEAPSRRWLNSHWSGATRVAAIDVDSAARRPT